MSLSGDGPARALPDKIRIVRLDSFDGRDTHLRCGNDEQDFLFCVIQISDDGTAEVMDSGYRSFDEAFYAWSESSPA